EFILAPPSMPGDSDASCGLQLPHSTCHRNRCTGSNRDRAAPRAKASQLFLFERSQRQTHPRYNPVPRALFSGGISEVEAVNRSVGPARKIAATVINHAGVHGRDGEE